MASQEESELCREILKEFYGDLAEKLVATLFNYGRLTSAQISKFIDLPVPIVRRILVPLIQNRFVLYWINPDSPRICHYYANPTHIIHSLAIPQILTTITSKFPGKDSSAPDIIKNIFAYGHIRASDYIEGSVSQSATEITENGNSDQPDDSREKITKAITSLIEQKYLVPLFDFDFKPAKDLRMHIYQKELKKLPRTSSESSRKATATDAMEKVYAETLLKRDSDYSGLIVQETNRSANYMEQKNSMLRRPKYIVDPEAVLAVNNDRFMVIFRNDELAGIAARNVGRVSAYVYRLLLKLYEDKIKRCSQKITPDSGFLITSVSVVQNFRGKINISSSIVTRTPQYGSNSHSDGNSLKRSAEDFEGDLYSMNHEPKRSKIVSPDSAPFVISDEQEGDDFFHDTSGNGNGNGYGINGSDYDGPANKITVNDVNKHLELIAASPLKLIVKQSNRGGGEWFVPFDSLRDTMRKLRYDEIISNKFGPEALRILRIVREKGMANDELLARTALLRSETIHKHCLQLHSFGALELQEVPRSADRAPSKTIFMWFHRPQRAYTLAEEYIAKALTRLLKRVRAERMAHRILLAKLQREDVKENEDIYLTSQEKLEIAQLRSKEEKLLVQVNRLQSLFRVFSEY